MMVCSFPLSALWVVWYDIVLLPKKIQNLIIEISYSLLQKESKLYMKLQLLLHGFGKKVSCVLK